MCKLSLHNTFGNMFQYFSNTEEKSLIVVGEKVSRTTVFYLFEIKCCVNYKICNVAPTKVIFFLCSQNTLNSLSDNAVFS